MSTMTAENTAMDQITVDPSAIERLNLLREREGLGEDVKLRVAIVGGGCSGFKYAMGLTDEVFEDDQVFSDAVVIDQDSLRIMAGSTWLVLMSKLSRGPYRFVGMAAMKLVPY